MARQSNRKSRVQLNRLLSRLTPKPTDGWSSESIQWAVPGPSMEFYSSTTSTTTSRTTTRWTPLATSSIAAPVLADIQADEPIELTTPDIRNLRSHTPCLDVSHQLAGMRVALGLCIGLTLLISLGLVYVVWLFHRKQDYPMDEESGISHFRYLDPL